MPRALENKGSVMTMDHATFVIASAAVTSPLWLQDLGSVAGDIIPLAGLLWLVIQIAHKLVNWSAKPDDKRGA